MLHPHKLYKSFKYAGKGVAIVFRTEQNFRIQIMLAVLVILVAVLLDLPSWKIVVLILISVSVMALELVNSIFERLIDSFAPRVHQYVAEMKDIMAATVLLASVGAVIIGIILFWDYLALFFNQMVQSF